MKKYETNDIVNEWEKGNLDDEKKWVQPSVSDLQDKIRWLEEENQRLRDEIIENEINL